MRGTVNVTNDFFESLLDLNASLYSPISPRKPKFIKTFSIRIPRVSVFKKMNVLNDFSHCQERGCPLKLK